MLGTPALLLHLPNSIYIIFVTSMPTRLHPHGSLTPSRGYTATSCSSCCPQGIMRYQLHQGIFAQGFFWGGVKIRKQNRSVTSLNVCLPASPRASPVPAVGPAPIINHHPWRGNVCLIPGTYCGGRACLIQCNR